MSIIDEKISHREGQTSYKARVKSFSRQMTTWENGKVMHFKSFSVDGVNLRLKVYPNGYNQALEGYVSVFIENLSDFEVRLTYDFSFGSIVEKKDITATISPHTMKGKPRLYCHSGPYRRRRGESLVPDEDAEITLRVKEVWKEFVDEDTDSRSPVIEAISTVQDSVSHLEDKIENLE